MKQSARMGKMAKEQRHSEVPRPNIKAESQPSVPQTRNEIQEQPSKEAPGDKGQKQKASNVLFYVYAIIGLALVSLCGSYVLHDNYIISTIARGGFIAFLLLAICFCLREKEYASRKAYVILGTLAGIGIIITVLCIVFHKEPALHTTEVPKPEQPKAPPEEKVKNLQDYFKEDFNERYGGVGQDHVITLHDTRTKSDVTATVGYRLIPDYDAHVFFLDFYVPPTPNAYDFCEYLLSDIPGAIPVLQTKLVKNIERQVAGERGVELKDLKFSGRVFIYHESPLLTSDQDSLRAIYKKKKMELQMRGPDYLFYRNNPPSLPAKIPSETPSSKITPRP